MQLVNWRWFRPQCPCPIFGGLFFYHRVVTQIFQIWQTRIDRELVKWGKCRIINQYYEGVNTMTVKILIKRKFKNANSKNVSAVIGQSRKNAMREEGYILLRHCVIATTLIWSSCFPCGGIRRLGTTIRIALPERKLRRNIQNYSKGRQNMNLLI